MGNNFGGRTRDVTGQDGVPDQRLTPETGSPSSGAAGQDRGLAPTLVVKGVNLSAERTVNSRTVLVEYIHNQTVLAQDPAMKEEEESAASSARRQHTLEGMSDNLFLDELLSDLERQILLRHGLFQKLKRAYGLLDRRPGHFDPLQPWDLFQAMVNEGRLSSSDVLCLQLLLHKCGSPDLADLVTKHAKKMEEEHGIHMMYFCVPVLEPTQGHRYVSLHVTKPDVDAGSQGFLQKLARLLHVGVEMVRVVGCQLTGSVWVTLLLPQACVVTLEAALERGDHKTHWQLAVLGVDHVSTIQVAPDPTRRDLFEAAARGQKYEKEVDLEEVLKESMNFLKNAPDPNDLDPDWDRAPAAGKTGTAGHTQPSGRRQEPGKARSKGSRISGPKAEAAMM